jgi:hypothetical protein
MHEQLSSASGNCRKINSLHLQPRNSPTVLNAGFQFAQFWDGRSSNLEAQAKEPTLNPDEMGLPAEADLLKRLRGLKTYQTRFPEAFSDRTEPISITSARHSIVSGGYRIHCGIPPLPLGQRSRGAECRIDPHGCPSMAHLREHQRPLHHTRQQRDIHGSWRDAFGQLTDGLFQQFILRLEPVILRMAVLTAVDEINLIGPLGNLLVGRRFDMFGRLCHRTLDGGCRPGVQSSPRFLFTSRQENKTFLETNH